MNRQPNQEYSKGSVAQYHQCADHFFSWTFTPQEQNTSIDTDKQQMMISKNFLRRVIPFMMTAFVRYLRKYNLVLTNFEYSKRNYELTDLLKLVEQDSGGHFTQAFEEFIPSKYLEEYILNNQRVQSIYYKQLYLKTRSLFLEEIQKKEGKFKRFFSNANAAKISEYQKEIKQKFIEEHSHFVCIGGLYEQEKQIQEMQSYANNFDQFDQVQDNQFESQVFQFKNLTDYENDND